METYLETVLEQVRCKKVHPYIREEIQGHIELQIEENRQKGMPLEEAQAAAIRDMGDPVEVGISLDKVHRPQMDLKSIAIVAVMSMIGIILHQILVRKMGEQAIGSNSFTGYTLLGFGLMFLVYRMDYTVIARYAKALAIAFLLLCTFLHIGDIRINGWRAYHAMFSFMTMYVPLYAAVLYKDRGQGYKAIVKALLWMLLPVVLAYKLPCLSLAVILAGTMLIVLTMAILLGWYQVSKKKVVAALWGGTIVGPLLFLGIALKYELLEIYQIVRLRSFFSSDSPDNYITNVLRKNITEIHFLGENGKNLGETLINFNNDYILSYVMSTYGALAGIILCFGLVILLVRMFAVSMGQKNQLGRCMGCGCGAVLLVNLLINIGENLGIIPLSQTYLPFLSPGGSNILVSYILLGIVLSIHRYRNVYPKHINAKLSAINITIEL